MRSILEQAFVSLLNEETDKAEELFHKFIIEKARAIHESNRNDEDHVLDENWNDEITTESYFTEDDLAGLEDHDGEDDMSGDDSFPVGDDVADDGEDDGFGAEDEIGDEFKDDDLGDEPGEDDLGSEEDSPEERIDHLEDQIEKLTAEFEAMMDAIGDEGEEADQVGDEVSDEFGDEDHTTPEDEEEASHVQDDMDGVDEEPAMEGEETDDYDDITESIIDELEKVSVTLDDGKEVGAGGSVTQNRKSSLEQKNKDARQGGSPIKMKQDAHKGFERETAPPVETLKPRRNNVKTTASVLAQKVSKEGDKSAELNKLSSENGNTKSPLDGK